MLPIINLTSNRNFKIRNFEEDKTALLNAFSGLRYIGKDNGNHLFHGNFYLLDPKNELIESFEIAILVEKNYPNTFPSVLLCDDKIEKIADYHINKAGVICLEHTYIVNYLANKGLRIYDCLKYYLPKYFSWAMVKKYGNAVGLQQWSHQDAGIKEFYETLLETNDKDFIRSFLKIYCKSHKVDRNDKCYCNSNKKLKYCHLQASLFLKNVPNDQVIKDIELFR